IHHKLKIKAIYTKNLNCPSLQLIMEATSLVPVDVVNMRLLGPQLARNNNGRIRPLWNRANGKTIECDRVGNGLGVEDKRIPVKVCDVVADKVVVDIVRHPSFTAKELGFLLRLDT